MLRKITLKSRPKKPQIKEFLSLPLARFLYLCFHEAAAENIHQLLETHSIPTLSCTKVKEWPGTVYSGETPVFGLKIAVEDSSIEAIAELLDSILSDDLCRFYCDFSFLDEKSYPWFIAIPHENDYFFNGMYEYS